MHIAGRAEASSQFSEKPSFRGSTGLPENLELFERSMTWGSRSCFAGLLQSREGAMTKVGIWRACTASALVKQFSVPGSQFSETPSAFHSFFRELKTAPRCFAGWDGSSW